jgi:SAM-dependent methyltransferase
MVIATADFYDVNASTYFEQTVTVDPEGFLGPFADRLVPGSRVLDIGCGSGRDLLWLKSRGYQVKGIERSWKLAELARKHAGCEVVAGDFESWNFSGNPVDGLLLVGALVHIPHEDVGRILGHIISGLVPRGKVLLTLKEGEGASKGTDGRIFYLWKDSDLREILTGIGLEVLYFDRLVSAIRKGDIWLTYVLEKADGGRAHR